MTTHREENGDAPFGKTETGRPHVSPKLIELVNDFATAVRVDVIDLRADSERWLEVLRDYTEKRERLFYALASLELIERHARQMNAKHRASGEVPSEMWDDLAWHLTRISTLPAKPIRPHTVGPF